MSISIRSAIAATLVLMIGLGGCGKAQTQTGEAAKVGIQEFQMEDKATAGADAEENIAETARPEETPVPAADPAEGESAEGEGAIAPEVPEATPEPTATPAPDAAPEADAAQSPAPTEEAEEKICVLEADWFESDIQSIFAVGVTATITDVNTGISWQEVRMGGSNHADVQPCTAKDTAKLKKVYGGDWSWKRRAIWVTIDGKTYAASMNGKPHGQGSVSGNRFDGHHCIHFTNSRTHSSRKIDTNHQKMVQKALRAGQ